MANKATTEPAETPADASAAAAPADVLRDVSDTLKKQLKAFETGGDYAPIYQALTALKARVDASL